MANYNNFVFWQIGMNLYILICTLSYYLLMPFWWSSVENVIYIYFILFLFLKIVQV